MTWNFRIIEHDLGSTAYFAIHEVYYDDKDRITHWTIEPINIVGESKSDVMKMLKQMILDSNTLVLKESELAKELIRR